MFYCNSLKGAWTSERTQNDMLIAWTTSISKPWWFIYAWLERPKKQSVFNYLLFTFYSSPIKLLTALGWTQSLTPSFPTIKNKIELKICQLWLWQIRTREVYKLFIWCCRKSIRLRRVVLAPAESEMGLRISWHDVVCCCWGNSVPSERRVTFADGIWELLWRYQIGHSFVKF